MPIMPPVLQLWGIAPTREASAKHVDEYIDSVQDRLRTTLWEAQAQLTMEAHQQKWYYDRKIGTMNLKPGDLVLVKADAFKGKRKIKDRWEEDTWEVVHQIATDIPSFKVMDQLRRSHILHQNWLLLVTSEVGIPLCIGVHHAWVRCTSPPHASPPPWEVKLRRHHKRTLAAWSPNALPARLPWGGSMGSYDFYHGHPLEHP